jgi:cell division protein FtsZ
MGGGTGTGAAPVIAEVARELGILTVAVVTKPFPHEGKKRMAIALEGIRELQQFVDSLILIPNEKLRLVLGGAITLMSGFKAANDVLQNAVQGISDLITRPGFINVDFADVKTVMSNRGMAMMGLGTASGDDRARKAVEAALSSPLLDDLELTGARGILVNITCDDSLTIDELELINERIGEIASGEADMKSGTSFDPSLNGELRVTVVATGLEGSRIGKQVQPELVQPQLRGVGGTYPSPVPGRVAPSIGSAPQVVAPLRGAGSWPSRGGEPGLAVARAGARANPALGAFEGYNEELLDIPAFLRAQAD